MLEQGVVSPPRFHFEFPEEGRTCGCPGLPRLRRTTERVVLSLAYGRFVAVERTGYCPGHPALPVVRSAALARLVAPGAKHAFDLLVRVGIAHHIESRQCAEIGSDLADRFGLRIPVRTIGHLAREFVAFVQAVHEESIPRLRRDILARGGYILHVDGTCEEGSRVVFVCMDSVSGQVLDSRKIASENAKEVGGVLRDVRRDWGIPLAVVHDLGPALLAGVGEVFPEVPQFVCHFHLAADVGKDILEEGVDALRRLFRQTKIRPKLAAVARSLREFAVRTDGAHVVSAFLDPPSAGTAGPAVTEVTGLGTVHGLVCWILAFSRAGHGYGFPFDIVWLELFDRVVGAWRILAGLETDAPPGGNRVGAEVQKVRRILAQVVEGEHSPEFSRLVSGLRRDRRIFDAFRERLRICPREGKRRRNDEGAPAAVDPDQHRTILANFKVSLQRRMRPGSGVDRACRIIVQHLDKYWSRLFGHRLGGSQGTVVPRTNNRMEQEFRKVKRGCRRLHGRGHLTRDVDEMPAGTILLQNLKDTAYRTTVYGDTTEAAIAVRFSEIDPARPAEIMRAWKKDRSTCNLPRKLEQMKDLPGRLGGVLRDTAGLRKRA